MSDRPKPPEGFETWLDFALELTSDNDKDWLVYCRAELAELRKMKKWCDARGEKYWQATNMTWVGEDVYATLREKAAKWDLLKCARDGPPDVVIARDNGYHDPWNHTDQENWPDEVKRLMALAKGKTDETS